MWFLRAGQHDRVLRNLDLMSQEYRHEVNELLEKAGKKTLPVKPNEDYASIEVRFCGLPPDELQAYQTVAIIHSDASPDEGIDALRRRQEEVKKAKRSLVAAGVVEVKGLTDYEGNVVIGGPEGLDDVDLDVLSESGLLDELAIILEWWQRLPSAKKKRSGAPAPSTSPATSSTAASAANDNSD